MEEQLAGIDLIVLEHDPLGSGTLEFLGDLRENPQHNQVPVVVLSSISDFDIELQQKYKIAHCLTKPVKQTVLFSVVQSLFQAGSQDVPDKASGDCAKEKQDLTTGQILLVEDTKDNQVLATKILETAGHKVDLAENGREAVDAVLKFNYDLILMDIQMPKMDGFEATQKIRAHERQSESGRVPIIAFTAHALGGYKEKCLQNGMDDYVTKPVKKRKLLDAVAKWLDPRPTILVVDDSIDNRQLLENFFSKREDFKTVFVVNGEEAVKEYETRPLSLILMDMEMPVMDGYTATSKIRSAEQGSHIPIVALTAHNDSTQLNKCLASGCDQALTKPIRKKTLFKVVEDYLSTS